MSTIKVDKIQNSSGVEQYTAKAWVNFDGTGTVAIRASGNVSSITDNGTGDYTINMTNPMPDINYSVNPSTGGSSMVYMARTQEESTARTVSAFSVGILNSSASRADAAYVQVSVFR